MQDKEKKLYDPKADPQMQKPYIDSDTWETREGFRCRMVHGGFEGAGIKFQFVFPEAERYIGRFYQYLSPFPGPDEEIASLKKKGVDDRITFALAHGAYWVETNMGSAHAFGPSPDATMIYRSCAAAAEYSRVLAIEMYNCDRPYGYVYGGSGGGFKTMSCAENTIAFDGSVPYVIGSPVAIPYSITVRGHGKRVLRNVISQIADALEPGGSGDPYAGLNAEEAEALREVSRFGFPLRAWLQYPYLDDGALPVLGPQIKQADPTYFEKYWTQKGFLGADPNGSARRDRIYLKTTVQQVHLADNDEAAKENAGGLNGVDDAWTKMIQTSTGQPWLVVAQLPDSENLYLDGCLIRFLTGGAAGQNLNVEGIEDGRLLIGTGYGQGAMEDVLGKVRPGDEVLLDNSDYIAVQTLHRHMVPDRQFTTWDQYRDADGNPLYPQHPVENSFKDGGAAVKQHGRIQGKMIVVASTEDESALPWQPDWYRRTVAKANPGREEELIRMWYVEHSRHDDQSFVPDPLHLVPYLPVLYQALLDIGDWVEKGIAPHRSTGYTVEEGQVIVAPDAKARMGVQPLASLKANGGDCARVKVGEQVLFEAVAEVPVDGGCVTAIDFSFEGEADFPHHDTSIVYPAGGKARVEARHSYSRSGTYFAVVRVKSNVDCDADDGFTQLPNIASARVIVEA